MCNVVDHTAGLDPIEFVGHRPCMRMCSLWDMYIDHACACACIWDCLRLQSVRGAARKAVNLEVLWLWPVVELILCLECSTAEVWQVRIQNVQFLTLGTGNVQTAAVYIEHRLKHPQNPESF